MARARTTPSRPSGGRPSASDAQTYDGTMSGYGATRGDSVGAAPTYPYAYKAQSLKAFRKYQQVNKGKRYEEGE